MMEKYKFVREYNFRTSPKIIYQYISNPGGLQQWFAQTVNLNADNVFSFDFGDKIQRAQLSSRKLNKSVKFDFIEGESKGNYIEFKLENSNLDSTCYLYITDYSPAADEDDLVDMWDGLIDDLKDIIGG
jgi:uncharacterized protein YndB with AHSA1/START domain